MQYIVKYPLSSVFRVTIICNFFFVYISSGQGLIVNEISNGLSGKKEYIELLVIHYPSETCSSVDIRSFIVDDNNGMNNDGFGVLQINSGVSQGHLRFKPISRWQSVPAGAIILIYNESDINSALPPDDPDDTNPCDSIYILPADDTGIQRAITIPSGSGGNPFYSPVTYISGSWVVMNFRNEGDAGQVRNPDGSYFHGFSYGSLSFNMSPQGGPDSLMVYNADGSGKVFYFKDADYRNKKNFFISNAAILQTPGAPNSIENLAFIDSLKNSSCVLPVKLLSFNVDDHNNKIVIQWCSSIEINNSHFLIEKSWNGSPFYLIGKVQGTGNSYMPKHYQYIDFYPKPGFNYYRLKQVDINNNYQYLGLRKIKTKPSFNLLSINKNLLNNQLKFEIVMPGNGPLSIKLTDINGVDYYYVKKLTLFKGYHQIELFIPGLKFGLYLVKFNYNHYRIVRKWICY